MSQTPSRAGTKQGAKDYEVRVQGHIGARWATHLEAASLVNEPDGTTTLLVRVLDQAALHGLLQKIRDLGLPLVSVARAGPDRADPAPIDARQGPAVMSGGPSPAKLTPEPSSTTSDS